MLHNEEYDIAEAFRRIENELIASMIRNMDRHRAEEDKEGLLWSQWQVEQLKTLEYYKTKNQKKYTKQFQDLNKRIEELIRIANETGNMEQEIEILEAIKNGFTGYRKASGTMQAEFFKMNERKLEALIQATMADMQKAETAILRMANDKYRSAIYNAQVYANTGAGTYEKAVDMATKDMLAAGLNCVQYANGARHTLADYADMAIRTASKRAYLQGEGTKRQEWGVATVIVNKRGTPCPKCLPFCGKVLIDDVWSGGSREDGDYPLMSYAIECGLYHPRCKDVHTTYFPGISTADDTWTKEELKAIGQNAKIEAKQQYTERQAEKFDRLEKYSLDNENKKMYQNRAEQWKEEADRLQTAKASGVSAKTIEEAQEYAKELGIKYPVYEKLSLEMANELNNALETLPEDIRPIFVGDSSTLEIYRGAKLPRSSNHYYGVHIDAPPEGLLLPDRERPGFTKHDFDAQGQMVAISKKFNSAEKITKNKVAEQKKYFEKHGTKWFFNEDGKSTPYHEMGHVYADTKGIPESFQLDAERWSKESGCDMLKNCEEAWAEAWGAYHTGNSDLPNYIAKYIDEATATKKIVAEMEFSPRKATKGDFGVIWSKVQSPEYRKSLEKLSSNSKVVDSIEVRAKWALNNRNGLKSEEMYAIELGEGKEIASILGQKNDFGVQRTAQFTQKLNEADKAKLKVLLIHNHPRGMPPSIGDINALFANENVAGITVGHNGSIYYYSRPKKIIPDKDFKVALMKYSKYTEITGFEKALEELSQEFGFELKKL